MVTNQSGQVVWMMDYQPFGKVAAGQTNSIEIYSRFPGQFYDAETGLYYNYFRDYDPSIGRYIESDPIGLKGGINTYAYVGGNPLTFIDPLGLNRANDFAKYGAVVGGGFTAAASVGVDAVTGGLNILATPAEIVAGAYLGSRIGYGFGAVADFFSESDTGDTPKDKPKECSKDDEDDICYSRWEREDSACSAWSGLGARVVATCKIRASDRRNLCVANGGKPNPAEPPEYNPFVDYPR